MIRGAATAQNSLFSDLGALNDSENPTSRLYLQNAAQAADEGWQQIVQGHNGSTVTRTTIPDVEQTGLTSQHDDADFEPTFALLRRGRLSAPQLQAHFPDCQIGTERHSHKAGVRQLKAARIVVRSPNVAMEPRTTGQSWRRKSLEFAVASPHLGIITYGHVLHMCEATQRETSAKCQKPSASGLFFGGPVAPFVGVVGWPPLAERSLHCGARALSDVSAMMRGIMGSCA